MSTETELHQPNPSMRMETGLDQPNGSIQTETGLDQPNGSTQTETGSAQNVLKHIKLHVAALQGDLETAKKYGDDLQLPITQNGETALHIAILAGQKEFVKKLVEWFGMPILEIQDEKGNDALSYAARIGSLDMVNVIVDVRDSIYPSLKSKKKALLKAASLGHTDITKRLSKLIDLQLLEDVEARRLYVYCVEMGLYGLATKMHTRHQICLAPAQEVSALCVLARQPSAFSDESQSSGLFIRFARLCGKFIGRENSNHSDHALQIVTKFWELDEEAQTSSTKEIENSLFIAAEVGNVDFIIKLIGLNPNLLWTIDKEKGSIFHVAVQHRQEKIFSLLLQLGGIKEILAKFITASDGNSLLHLVAELPPDPEKLNTVCGAALQLHRELVWFKLFFLLSRPSLSLFCVFKFRPPIALTRQPPRKPATSRAWPPSFTARRRRTRADRAGEAAGRRIFSLLFSCVFRPAHSQLSLLSPYFGSSESKNGLQSQKFEAVCEIWGSEHRSKLSDQIPATSGGIGVDGDRIGDPRPTSFDSEHR